MTIICQYFDESIGTQHFTFHFLVFTTIKNYKNTMKIKCQQKSSFVLRSLHRTFTENIIFMVSMRSELSLVIYMENQHTTVLKCCQGYLRTTTQEDYYLNMMVW